MSAKRWKMDDAAICSALKESTWGVLSLIDEDGRPYGVPLNYVYDEEAHALFMHCRKTGKKIRSLRHHAQAHFTVVVQQTLMAPIFVTHYDSLMLSGRVDLIEAPEEMTAAMLRLCARLAPDEIERRDDVIRRELPALTILRLNIHTWSGKCNRDD